MGPIKLISTGNPASADLNARLDSGALGVEIALITTN
jgi:hypothetical protein